MNERKPASMQQEIAAAVINYLKGASIGGPQLKKISKVIFDHQQIRDTKTHNPPEMLDLGDARNWGFDVENATDQDVTIALIGGSTNNPDAAGLVSSAISVTITNGTTAPVATNIWLPWLGLQISYAAAPTTGNINVTAHKQVQG